MMPIHVLPPDVAAKIAAGEVIERPASVAKELLENAFDAGAREIRVEIVQGGRRLIQVSDDGCGIPADEVELAFARHATSKLVAAEDLYRVRTLGFRGEALASIAAVSLLTLSTRTAGEAVGSQVRLEGGRLMGREALGRPQGTMVRVENLFFNTPARLKFMRADPTEAGHIGRLVSSYALAYPDKRLILQHNDRQVLHTVGSGKLLDAMVAIYGLDVAEAMLAVGGADEANGDPAEGTLELEEGGEIRVWGYTSEPSLHRNTRRDLTLFVNRRWIQDNSLSYAVEEAYRTLLPQGRHPLAVLHIEMPPEDVDVNIHPTKREVRFRREREVFAAVQRAVRRTLLSQRPVPVMGMPQGWGDARRDGEPWRPREAVTEVRPATAAGPAGGAATQGRFPLEMPPSAAPEERLLRAAAVAPRPERLPMLRVLGQVGQTYIIAEGPGGMYLIDQHAAHERIRYEELQAQRVQAAVASQELLEPLALDLNAQQAALLETHLDEMAAFGFDVGPFGGTTFLVKSVPHHLAGGDVAAAIIELLDTALDSGKVGHEAGFSWEEQTLITLACHTAIRAGQTLSQEEMRDLIRQLEHSAVPHTCPHGRPTMIHLSQAQLEREFLRR
jgi:DNA mismatch repair protein MutL